MTAAIAVPGQCDKQTARNLTRQIQGLLKLSWGLLKEAFDRRAWAALGYDSWETYCRRGLGSGVRRLSKEVRSEAVAELTSGDRPMPNRAIGSALGVAEETVRADLQAGAQNYAPEPEPAAHGWGVVVSCRVRRGLPHHRIGADGDLAVGRWARCGGRYLLGGAVR